MPTIEQKLAELGIALARPAAPAANYVAVRRSGAIVYVSGQISRDAEGVIAGRLGADMDVAAGQAAARTAAIGVLEQIRYGAAVPLEAIRAVLRLGVLVNSTADFTDQHLVANGASDLIVEALGAAGRHARAAFGVAALPLGAAVEIEAVVELGE